jgi:hypothetical protein
MIGHYQIDKYLQHHQHTLREEEKGEKIKMEYNMTLKDRRVRLHLVINKI